MADDATAMRWPFMQRRSSSEGMRMNRADSERLNHEVHVDRAGKTIDRMNCLPIAVVTCPVAVTLLGRRPRLAAPQNLLPAHTNLLPA